MDDSTDHQPPDVLSSDTPNQTMIHPLDAPPEQREKYKRFRAYNTGAWNGPRRENKEIVHRQDDLHLYDAISGQLDLTPYQKKRGRCLLDTFSIGDYTAPGRSAKSVIFALCIVVANADVPDGTRYWPHPDAASNDLQFEEVAEDIPNDWPDLVSLVMKLEHRLEV